MKHEQRLKDLLQTAKHVTPVAGARIAAAIYDRNELVATGFNSRKTHPLMAKFGKNDKAIHLHAEVDALRDAAKWTLGVEGCTMYIARAKADGSPGLAKPCEGCQRAIVAFGIKEVYWTE